MKFIFDLDGTVTLEETLPIISRSFNVNDEISKLTEKTVNGDVPFVESFIKRVQILGRLPVMKVADILGDVQLNNKLLHFIKENISSSVIATGNYIGWVSKIKDKIGCDFYASEGYVDENNNLKLTKILKKEDIVKLYKDQGEVIVYIGDGNNDAEAMRLADISIACGIVHHPAKSVLQVCDYAVFDSDALYRLLNQIKHNQPGHSIVISCAGIGSRLGLGQTKSLINLCNKSLIHYQLDWFQDVDDVRIVVGYQSADLINAVLKIRKDIIFVYNHDYFHTKTGASLYLGSRHANEFVIAWDGDLLVHPEDVKLCLEFDGQYVGVSSISTEDAVFVLLDDDKQVAAFSRDKGDYEWSGPACIKKENIQYVSGHVYSQIENCLPLPFLNIRAQDIDTYSDYEKAIKFIETWKLGNFKIEDYYNKLAKKITSPIETRNKAKDFSKFDIEFVKKYSGKDLSLLDFGSGTGLLINNIANYFKEIVVVEKYKKFSDFIIKSSNIDIINCDILNFSIDRYFDLITIFGVMNYFNSIEAEKIYSSVFEILKHGQLMLVKHQMGVNENVVIDGYSQELKTDYYSEYRWLNNEMQLITNAGFSIIETVDIYPEEFNRWSNTHFYALVCEKRSV